MIEREARTVAVDARLQSLRSIRTGRPKLHGVDANDIPSSLTSSDRALEAGTEGDLHDRVVRHMLRASFLLQGAAALDQEQHEPLMAAIGELDDALHDLRRAEFERQRPTTASGQADTDTDRGRVRVITKPVLRGDLGVDVELRGEGAVLTLCGEVDMLTAPVLGTALISVIDAGCRDVMLDLTNVGFMDASGLGVMAATVRQLGPMGRLSVRSPVAGVRRLLALSGLARVISNEAAG